MFIEISTRIKADKQTCFDLARDIDLHTESMVKSKERAIAGVTTGKISYGETVTWKAWHFCLPLKMTVKIVAFDAPNAFIDEVISGPFANFRHEHLFTSEGEETAMVDRLEFRMPGWIFGKLIGQWIVRPRLVSLLHVRNEVLKQKAESTSHL